MDVSNDSTFFNDRQQILFQQLQKSWVELNRPAIWARTLVLLEPFKCSFQFLYGDQLYQILYYIRFHKPREMASQVNDVQKSDGCRCSKLTFEMGIPQPG